MKSIFLLTPPFTQLNTPYPATSYLKGFLNTKGIASFQMDLGIEVILDVFSKNGLQQLKPVECIPEWSPNAKRMYNLWDEYVKTIDPVIEFLQGKNPTLAQLLAQGNYLPEASRFDEVVDLEWAFGGMGIQDKAKHLATLYLEDLSDFIKECVDEHFGFSRYAERLGRSANSFEELHQSLQSSLCYFDKISLRILADRLEEVKPALICISVPFPGNLYAAFRCAQFVKKHFPHIKTSMGGGFVNTELRELSDVRVFDYFDFICLDDGERPLENLLGFISGTQGLSELKRTFLKSDGMVRYFDNPVCKDYHQSELGTPDYNDLPLNRYVSVIEIANPMHSLWSDGRWNKLTMAHGCYWGKCTFCDITLDYIKLYEPIAAKLLVDRMEELIAATGTRGFHFVDEAAPPALMRELALEILRRDLVVSWWTNIRFEKSFTPDLCLLLNASGCMAVSGGLEVASDRLLQLIQKGVTVEQVAKVAGNLTSAGIMVHAYLMYGFPTQTVQETVDSLEMVRQLFQTEVIRSGFWHQFALTAHSPVGQDPEAYGLVTEKHEITFANNDIQFSDKTNIDHDKFSYGLKKSLYNYMHGIGYEFPLQEWFNFKIPRTTVDDDFILKCLAQEEPLVIRPHAKWVWLGKSPEISAINKIIKGKKIELQSFYFHNKQSALTIELNPEEGKCLLFALEQIALKNCEELKTYADLKSKLNDQFPDFELFWFNDKIQQLKEFGLLNF
ncbi:MAG: radical SAM protein [Saprospiraceae bacterium]|nr:radical SAM protein [Candidatus Vicinibacter affinis]